MNELRRRACQRPVHVQRRALLRRRPRGSSRRRPIGEQRAGHRIEIDGSLRRFGMVWAPHARQPGVAAPPARHAAPSDSAPTGSPRGSRTIGHDRLATGGAERFGCGFAFGRACSDARALVVAAPGRAGTRAGSSTSTSKLVSVESRASRPRSWSLLRRQKRRRVFGWFCRRCTARRTTNPRSSPHRAFGRGAGGGRNSAAPVGRADFVDNRREQDLLRLFQVPPPPRGRDQGPGSRSHPRAPPREPFTATPPPPRPPCRWPLGCPRSLMSWAGSCSAPLRSRSNLGGHRAGILLRLLPRRASIDLFRKS